MERQAQATANSTGIGFVGLLTCIFAAAKVFGFSSMSWWWVFSPIWISALATIAFLVIFLLVAFGYELYKGHKRQKRAKALRERRGY